MLHTLHSLEDVRHQYQWFAQMRATEPVWLDETSGCWHVFGYEEVKTVLSDFVQFSSQRNQRMAFRRTLVGNSLIAMDPPVIGPIAISFPPSLPQRRWPA